MELDFSEATAFIAAHKQWAVPLLFAVSFAESFAFLSLLVPGTAILAACGALIPSGTISVWALLFGAIPGAVFGDAVSFWLGRRYGPALSRRWPLSRHPEMLIRGEAFLARHGALSVGLGRFFGPLRAVVPLIAGMVRMKPGIFWAANVGSALVWAPVVMLPGALIGVAAEQDWLVDGRVVAGLLLAAAIAAALYWSKRISVRRETRS